MMSKGIFDLGYAALLKIVFQCLARKAMSGKATAMKRQSWSGRLNQRRRLNLARIGGV